MLHILKALKQNENYPSFIYVSHLSRKYPNLRTKFTDNFNGKCGLFGTKQQVLGQLKSTNNKENIGINKLRVKKNKKCPQNNNRYNSL